MPQSPQIPLVLGRQDRSQGSIGARQGGGAEAGDREGMRSSGRAPHPRDRTGPRQHCGLTVQGWH